MITEVEAITPTKYNSKKIILVTCLFIAITLLIVIIVFLVIQHGQSSIKSSKSKIGSLSSKTTVTTTSIQTTTPSATDSITPITISPESTITSTPIPTEPLTAVSDQSSIINGREYWHSKYIHGTLPTDYEIITTDHSLESDSLNNGCIKNQDNIRYSFRKVSGESDPNDNANYIIVCKVLEANSVDFMSNLIGKGIDFDKTRVYDSSRLGRPHGVPNGIGTNYGNLINGQTQRISAELYVSHGTFITVGSSNLMSDISLNF